MLRHVNAVKLAGVPPNKPDQKFVCNGSTFIRAAQAFASFICSSCATVLKKILPDKKVEISCRFVGSCHANGGDD